AVGARGDRRVAAPEGAARTGTAAAHGGGIGGPEPGRRGVARAAVGYRAGPEAARGAGRFSGGSGGRGEPGRSVARTGGAAFGADGRGVARASGVDGPRVGAAEEEGRDGHEGTGPAPRDATGRVRGPVARDAGSAGEGAGEPRTRGGETRGGRGRAGGTAGFL